MSDSQKECPFAHKSISACPAFHHENAHDEKFAMRFLNECPYGKNALDQCPYAHKHAGDTADCPSYSSFSKEFFSKCPYGKKAASECPHIQHKEHSHTEPSTHLDEFFTGCPYGRRAAEDCPYGHDVLEKAGIEVPPLRSRSDGEPVKCPFAPDQAKSEQTHGCQCPVSHNCKKVEEETTPKA